MSVIFSEEEQQAFLGGDWCWWSGSKTEHNECIATCSKPLFSMQLQRYWPLLNIKAHWYLYTHFFLFYDKMSIFKSFKWEVTLTVALHALVDEAIQQRATVVTESGAPIGVDLKLVLRSGILEESKEGSDHYWNNEMTEKANQLPTVN